MTFRLALLAALTLPAAAAPDAPPVADPRTVVLVRLDCSSQLGRREVTLFLNGTVRIREGTAGSEQLLLGEYGPDEVAAFRRRLAEVDLTEAERRETTVEGDWVERCQLELPDEAQVDPIRFRFGWHDTHSLALASLLRIVDDVASRARAELARSELPAGYRPAVGDRLARLDGEVFEVVGFTSDGNGVELTGLRQPITLYAPISDLRLSFARVVARRSPK
jgi:hypothetical protein